jgi:hypothetical protein
MPICDNTERNDCSPDANFSKRGLANELVNGQQHKEKGHSLAKTSMSKDTRDPTFKFSSTSASNVHQEDGLV